jgi:uncharacterized membrane protein YphA (DoxX/SURF4 family)
MKITSGMGLALARIGFGLYFISQAWDKTTHEWFTNADPLRDFLNGSMADTAGFYRPIIENVILPNASLFAILTTFGEWVAGLSLIFGLFTRVGALVAMSLNLNFMLVNGPLSGNSSLDRLFLLSCLGFVLASAGLEFGLDGTLSRVFGRIPVVGWFAGGNPSPKREPRIYSILARA